MTKEELKIILREKQGYLKSGTPKLSRLFGIPKKKCGEAVQEVRKELGLTADSAPTKPFKRMFFDIETSPNIMYSWRAGYKINLGHHNIIKERAIICICWKWEGDEKVFSLTWDENQCDKTMLEIFTEEMMKADEVIGHNGDRFDIPWLRTRAVMHQIPFPAYVKSLDTLRKVRNGGFNFNSNKLDYLAQVLLGEHKMETGGFSLWTSICESNCKESMTKMVDYCKKDVTLLERVYQKLYTYIKPETHVGAKLNGSKESCPGCGSAEHTHIKEMHTSAGTEQHLLQCTDCNKYYKVSKTVYSKMKD